jgi:hypothetical protein
MARGGGNRLLYREGDGTWRTRDVFLGREVSEYDMNTAGPFGEGAGDGVFLLKK